MAHHRDPAGRTAEMDEPELQPIASAAPNVGVVTGDDVGLLGATRT